MLRVSHSFPQGRHRPEEAMRNSGLMVFMAAASTAHTRHGAADTQSSVILQIILGRNEWSVIKFGVFGLTKPKLPITEEQRDWIDRSFVRLGGLVGAHRLFDAELMLPTPEHFPDRYDRSEAALQRMFQRMAARMHVNPAEVEVTLFASEDDLTNGLVPFYSSRGAGASGLYHHDPSSRQRISIDEFQMKDPMTLVAVIAHDLGHVILLRPGLSGSGRGGHGASERSTYCFSGLWHFHSERSISVRTASGR